MMISRFGIYTQMIFLINKPVISFGFQEMKKLENYHSIQSDDLIFTIS